MRLVCAECSAVYEVPDSLFGPDAREVRCNRCGYQWVVVGSHQGSAAAAQPVEAVPAPVLATDAPQPSPVASASASASAPEPPQLELLQQAGPEPVVAPAPIPEFLPAGQRVAATPQTAGDPVLQVTPPPLVAEPPPASTRALLAAGTSTETMIPPPDPEERRLYHDLAFGQTEQRPSDRSAGSGRTITIVIILIIIAVIAAIVFKGEIAATFPGMKGVYRSVGL